MPKFYQAASQNEKSRAISIAIGMATACLVAACSSGDDSSSTPPSLKFQVRSGFANIVSTGFSVGLSGHDNVVPDATDPTAFETFGPASAPIRRPVKDWGAWNGVMRVSSRSGPPENTPSCASATRQVDILVSLERNRDQYRTQDGLTIGYTADYKPVCAFRLDGSYWEWNRAGPLPVSASTGNLDGVQFTGTLIRLPNQNAVLQGSEQPTTTTTTGGGSTTTSTTTTTQNIPDNTESSLTSTTTLDSATSDSAILNFVYKTTLVGGGETPQNQTTLRGVSTEIGFRITPDGALLGVRYGRTGPLSSELENVVTLSLSSE